MREKLVRKDTVIVTGYLANGKIAYDQIFSTYSWYEEEHSLIDNPKARVFYKIRRVTVLQWDRELDSQVEWELHYAEDGQLVEKWKQVGEEREQVPVPAYTSP